MTNSGPAPALQVTANVSLPLGVSLMVGGTLGLDSTVHASPDGWTCVPVTSGARCTHGPLAAAASTTSYLQVAVDPGAPAGEPPAISVDSGPDRVTARGTSGVSAGGLPEGQAGGFPEGQAGGFPEGQAGGLPAGQYLLQPVSTASL